MSSSSLSSFFFFFRGGGGGPNNKNIFKSSTTGGRSSFNSRSFGKTISTISRGGGGRGRLHYSSSSSGSSSGGFGGDAKIPTFLAGATLGAFIGGFASLFVSELHQVDDYLEHANDSDFDGTSASSMILGEKRDETSGGSSLKRHPCARYGFPRDVTESIGARLFGNAFVAQYDGRTRNPRWTLEVMDRESLMYPDEIGDFGSSAASRKKSPSFSEDEGVPKTFRAKLNDFRNSGFDRGHLAAAGNFVRKQEEKDATFTLANVSPQVGNGFNRDYWARFESFIRNWTREEKHRKAKVFVVTGPLFLPTPVVEQQKQQQQHGVGEVVNNKSTASALEPQTMQQSKMAIALDDASLQQQQNHQEKNTTTNDTKENHEHSVTNAIVVSQQPSSNTIQQKQQQQQNKVRPIDPDEEKRKKAVKWEMRYPLIGEAPELVAVPTHFFKVILVDEHANDPEKDVTLLGDVVDYNAPPKSAKVAAFVLPNAYIDPNTPLSNFAVPLESLEAVSGLTFFPKATNDLQTRDDIDRSERQFLQGRLGDALKQNSNNNNKNTTKRLGGLSDEEHIKILLTDSTSSKERRESGFRESRGRAGPLGKKQPEKATHLCDEGIGCVLPPPWSPPVK